MSDWEDITNYSDINQSVINLTNDARNKGVQYAFGGKNPSSGAVDCSGWLCKIADHLGINLSGSAAEIARQAAENGALTQGKPIQPGDIVFGSGAEHAKNRFQGIGHTGLVVQDGDKLFVSESTIGGPQLTPIEKFAGRYQGKLYSAPIDFNQQREQARTDIMANRLEELKGQGQAIKPGSDFSSTAMNFFISKGYSPAQAAGITGNLIHESGGKTDILHDFGKGIGLAGWNGDRRQGLYQFAGTDQPDLMQQLAFIDYELNNTENKAGQALKNAKSPEQAAQVFSNLYERPGKPMMNQRIQYARNAMNQYSMGQSASMVADVSGKSTPVQNDWEDVTGKNNEWEEVTNQPQEEKSLGQKVAGAVSPFTKYALPAVGMTLATIPAAASGGLAEPLALAGGAYAGNKIQDLIETYAGQKPPATLQEEGKRIVGSGVEGLSGYGISKATEPIFNYLAKTIAPRMYQWTLKPSTTLTQPERKAILETGLEGGYPISRSGIDKLRNDMDGLIGEIDNLVTNATQSGNKIDMANIATRLDDTIQKYANAPIPSEYINKITEFKNKLLAERSGTITPNQAQQIKRDLYKMLPENAYGEQFTTLTNDMRKDLARGFKEELEAIIPEIKNLNKQWGAKKDFLDVLEEAVGRIDNRYPFGFYDILAGGTVGLGTHSPEYGLATALMSKVFHDPTVNSYIAMALKRMPLSNYRKLLANSLGYGLSKASGAENKAGEVIDKWYPGNLEPSFQP